MRSLFMTTPCPNLQNQRVLETGEGSGEGSGEACFLPATSDPTLDPTPVSLEKDEKGMGVVKKKKPRKSAAQTEEGQSSGAREAGCSSTGSKATKSPESGRCSTPASGGNGADGFGEAKAGGAAR